MANARLAYQEFEVPDDIPLEYSDPLEEVAEAAPRVKTEVYITVMIDENSFGEKSGSCEGMFGPFDDQALAEQWCALFNCAAEMRMGARRREIEAGKKLHSYSVSTSIFPVDFVCESIVATENTAHPVIFLEALLARRS